MFMEDDKLPDDVLRKKYSDGRMRFVAWSTAWGRSLIRPSKIPSGIHYMEKGD
jgi:hypothetical protein